MTKEQRGPRQALLVIGMHRSGTSALTRLINLHGITLGSDLLEAAFDNEAGFWENRKVVEFHERVLVVLDSSWDDPRELHADWLEQVRAAGLMDELAAIIVSEFGDMPIWAVKDPRLCRLLPMWLETLARLDIEPKLIFAMRHPGEVAGSLIRRNDLSAATATLIWLRHLVEPVKASRYATRCITDYNAVLGDWRACMVRIADDLGLVWPVSSARCADEADACLRHDLRHQNSTTTEALLPEVWRDSILNGYASGLAVMEQRGSWADFEASLDALMVRFEFARPLMAELQPRSNLDRLAKAEQGVKAYRAEAERLLSESGAARKEVARVKQELVDARGELAKRNARIRVLEQVRDELDLIKASRSWRWTRFLRFALRVLRGGGRLGDADRDQLRRQLKRARGFQSKVAPNESSVFAGLPVQPTAWLATPSNDRRDVFVWAVIDWHFRIQRPQHLSRELAHAGHRVFYVSNDFIDHDEPGFAVEPLDDEGRLFRIRLHLKGCPAIYHAVPTPVVQQQLCAGVGQLLSWTRSRACLSLVQHPYWLEAARILPNERLAYDCMDHHGGFADNSPEVLERENELMRKADLLVVTSDWLYEEAGKYNPHCLTIRNACQYDHFAIRPNQVFRDKQGRKVIGYYGAIAEWFDLDLLEKVAQRHADCLVLLIGADTTGAQQRLRHLANVEFTGEVPYAELPYYLHGFDVCLLPFQVIPLTLATNPVKVYEYLSAGKEVVSIALPEIRQFGDLVRTGDGHAAFLVAVDEALRVIPDPDRIARRQRFAAEQTWAHRVHDLIQGVDALPESRVSVVVVTYNNLDLTKVCLRSLEQYSDYTNLEIVVVDNASSDGTPDYLTAWAAAGRDRRLILNPDNRGFAAANNQGLSTADGDYLVLLNNDTHVTPGWIATLVSHLRRTEGLGMVGPVTNNIGNEARVEISYDNMESMLHAAADYTARHAGQLTPLRTAAFFCVMMPRRVYEAVGELDEAFGIGMFEDDDYCRRVQHAGWSIACADDVFIHHHLSASFSQIKQEKRQAMFEQNKAIYEAKWGPWEPHKYRQT
ncbi:glycosyltransferase [Rhodanobacter sp. 7MK24]|uniref:glycosyltransferase n=1 Tax=Rhodanobacter sp. 7MK24 TaxID=2775922 RepID=UPI0017845ADA|nr:glycosyltransferase [Rhodanobacter sp. 7MK24]MBD8881281.1 glycosyltransferase [Rhodanobacter sp. 7MK24]